MQVIVGVSVLCALVMTGVVMWREFSGGGATGTGAKAATSTVVAEWQDLVRDGHPSGPPDAPVTLVQFADFECPYCRAFALADLPAVMARYPDQVQVIHRHFPLPYHRFARSSAIAAECASRQGRFREMHDQLYELQDSLGLISFSSIARRAGVADSVAFLDCVGDTKTSEIVERDFQLGMVIGVSATPTLVINGRKYDRPLSRPELASVIDGIVAPSR
jgi:protein-disulfide isomerase